MCFYLKRYEIADLNGELLLKEVRISDLKKKTEILVIDDDSFTYLETLKRCEYRIDYRADIQSLNDVAEYDIILCDVRGVGKFLDSDFQGAFLVKQIREKYPNKIIIAYTASNYDPKFSEFLAFADETVVKGTSLEDWDGLLKEKLHELVDPVKQWQKTRSALLQSGVSIGMVAKYESDFVKAVKKDKYESLKTIYEKSKTQGKEIFISLLKLIIRIAK